MIAEEGRTYLTRGGTTRKVEVILNPIHSSAPIVKWVTQSPSGMAVSGFMDLEQFNRIIVEEVK
jgi:hypothetical protein